MGRAGSKAPTAAQAACATGAASKLSVVATDRGAVRGERAGEMYAFKGIPYAASPVGNLRRRPPDEHDCWTGHNTSTSVSPDRRCSTSRRMTSSPSKIRRTFMFMVTGSLFTAAAGVPRGTAYGTRSS